MNMKNFLRSCIRNVFGKCLPRIAYPVICGPLKGVRFILGALSGDGGGASVYINKVEVEQTKAFTKILSNGQILFDIGANVGYYTLLGARLVGLTGKVFAFEPVIRNLAYLYHHTVLNKINNAIIISAACSDSVSLTKFSIGINYSVGHLINNKNNESSLKEILLPVPTVTVDAIVQQLGVSPDVIKIDVEGAELSVLKGAKDTISKKKPVVFLSTHSDELRTLCLEYLKEFGYTFEVLSQNKNNPSEFLAKHSEK